MMASTDESNEEHHPVPLQAVYFPAVTWDYRVTATGKHGFGLVAARNIKQGELIYSDSIEFSFSDVINGDGLLWDRHQVASRKDKAKVPPYFPLTRETLVTTHGVPQLSPDPTGETAGTISWLLEVPGMMMNHSCDPTVTTFPPCNETGEGYARRDIQKGEELTSDYVIQFYDHGPFFEECTCGAVSCRGSMMGFKALSDADKERLLPAASNAVKAMYHADIGKGPPVKMQQEVFPERLPSADGVVVPRIVFPGPGCQSENIVDIRSGKLDPDIAIKRDDSGRFGLYAMRKFAPGDIVYYFWRTAWPIESMVIDMVLAKPAHDGDPPEGTVIRFNALECATRDLGGERMFSGWDMLTRHSCQPNVVYEYEDWEEEEDWCRTYAAREIHPGDLLTMDFNCIFWDRSDCVDIDLDTCNCASKKSTGTKGFKFLSNEEKEAYKMLSAKHLPPPYEDGDAMVEPGEALAPYVHEQWRKDKGLD